MLREGGLLDFIKGEVTGAATAVGDKTDDMLLQQAETASLPITTLPTPRPTPLRTPLPTPLPTPLRTPSPVLGLTAPLPPAPRKEGGPVACTQARAAMMMMMPPPPTTMTTTTTMVYDDDDDDDDMTKRMMRCR